MFWILNATILHLTCTVNLYFYFQFFFFNRSESAFIYLFRLFSVFFISFRCLAQLLGIYVTYEVIPLLDPVPIGYPR